MSCPFELSLSEAEASTEDHAHELLLKTDYEDWCTAHMLAYSSIRKSAPIVGKRLLIAMIKLVPECGGPERLLASIEKDLS